MLPKLADMGFAQSDFVGAISSGEIAWTAIADRKGDFWTMLGNRCLHITWGSRGKVSLAGLDLKVNNRHTAIFQLSSVTAEVDSFQRCGKLLNSLERQP